MKVRLLLESVGSIINESEILVGLITLIILNIDIL